MSNPKRVPTVVTFLEMTKRPTGHPPPQPKGKIAIMRVENPAVHFYRYLYDTIGDAYYWVDRRKKSDEQIAEIIGHPANELYVIYTEGAPAGMAELDFADPKECQLAYFGLMPEAIGRGVGAYFLHQAISIAWDKPIARLLVNTCTLDHPRALPLYQRLGFSPYSREERYIELP